MKTNNKSNSGILKLVAGLYITAQVLTSITTVRSIQEPIDNYKKNEHIINIMRQEGLIKKRNAELYIDSFAESTKIAKYYSETLNPIITPVPKLISIAIYNFQKKLF